LQELKQLYELNITMIQENGLNELFTNAKKNL
jgi:hypothetical protein